MSAMTRSRHRNSKQSRDLDNDFPLGSTLLKIRKSLLRLFERKYLVDHRPNASRFYKLADFCELTTVRVHEQERIRDAAFLRASNDLAAQQSEHEQHEKVHATGARERGVRGPDQRDDSAIGSQNSKGFFERIAP